MASAASDFVREVWERYQKIVRENPETVSQLESTFKVVSYVIAGRFEDSQVLSELVYLASNLLILLNDTIFRQTAKVLKNISVPVERWKRFLTVLQYAEVFLEMAAQRAWGETGRWFIILVVQLTKTVIRMMLLWKHKGGFQTNPPQPPLDRDQLLPKLKRSVSKELLDLEENLDGENESPTFTLKSSGKVMRRLSTSPPINFRTWKLPSEEKSSYSKNKKLPYGISPTSLSKQRLYAETFYIIKPLLHLFSMRLFGIESWKPFLLSGFADVSSLCMIGDPQDLNQEEKQEIKKRTYMLLLYLLKSPMYDRHTKVKILSTLQFISDHVPLTGLILRPLAQYLPAWQKVYFYLWST
ncbi:peroxisomal membrane protein PEX16-like [Mytilus californianus]|uniref:peroxisomal membrane protein PEX16-like n=1 Tax=Mytilus californianus TaxID=6549 RepID=UPI002246874A|nr:peroxisomal membrane protein PEX16-like [Mytilus californianus]